MGTHECCRTRLLLITTFFWVSFVLVVIGVPDDECPDTNPASETCEYDEVCDEARCKYNEYATCHPNRCGTCEAVFRTYDHAMVNCTRLTPKCRLMHLEMLHNRQSAAGSSASDEVWDLVDLDEPFEPSCHSNGSFQSKQCDSDSGLCWCVDSAGVRVTDKKVDGPQCVRLVQVHLIQIDLEFRDDTNKIILGRTPELKRRVAEMMVREYTIKKSQIVEISVKETQLKVSIKISENNTKEPVDIATVAYYVERDVKRNVLPLVVAGHRLEPRVVLVLYFDNEAPRINMKSVFPGVAAIIIVIALAVLTGISVFVVVTRRSQEEKYRVYFIEEGQEMVERREGSLEIE
ncbi:tumor-associated calcium signal transducer 2-like isoform X1 [Lethenteron reissneri]|uniref:tumor-associated calcium signal transducer 2-like isoform X1 n=1 Tax=Lethenteron reissneri TaxID=7753 RepID=UPI002AB68AA2|nr:tumor-associated calcium signal transducer 2-like isoform X1 [Lethenteron reissneri]